MDDPVGQHTLEVMSQAQHYNSWLFNMIKPWLKGSVAEVGAGVGNFVGFFLKSQLTITAIDINPTYLQRLSRTHQKVTTFQFDLESSSVPTSLLNRFDTVVSLNVLEHLPNISRALKNISAMLKPGGLAIILVPTFNFAYSPLDKNLGHVKRYSIGQIRDLTNRAGFQEIKSFYINPIGLLGWFIIGKILKRGTIPPTSVRIFDMVFRPVLWLEKYLHFPFGLSLITVVQKS